MATQTSATDGTDGSCVPRFRIPSFAAAGGYATAPTVLLYISHSHLIFKLLVVKISHVLLWQFIF